MEIRMRSALHRCLPVAALAAALLLPAGAWGADAAAAQQLARQSNCLKCHAVDRKKEGPAFKDVAAKYKGKPEARGRIFEHVTSGEKVKFEDGHEEDHAIVKTKDKAQIDNHIDWILAQ
jgi:cytochrome c